MNDKEKTSGSSWLVEYFDFMFLRDCQQKRRSIYSAGMKRYQPSYRFQGMNDRINDLYSANMKKQIGSDIHTFQTRDKMMKIHQKKRFF